MYFCLKQTSSRTHHVSVQQGNCRHAGKWAALACPGNGSKMTTPVHPSPHCEQQASSKQGSAHVKAAIRSSWPMRPISLSEGKLHCCSRLHRASARLTALQKMTTCKIP